MKIFCCSDKFVSVPLGVIHLFCKNVSTYLMKVFFEKVIFYTYQSPCELAFLTISADFAESPTSFKLMEVCSGQKLMTQWYCRDSVSTVFIKIEGGSVFET